VLAQNFDHACNVFDARVLDDVFQTISANRIGPLTTQHAAISVGKISTLHSKKEPADLRLQLADRIKATIPG
jgi:hypothetical protein